MNDLNTNLDTDNPSGQGAGFELMLAAFADFGEKQAKAITSLKDAKPLLVTHWGSNTAVAGINPTLVTLTDTPGPAVGRCWAVSTVGIYGTTDAHTAVAGTAEFYAGDSPDAVGTAGQPMGPLFPDNFGPGGNPGVTIPNFFALTRRVIWVNHAETVYALVYGATAGQQIVLVATVEDYAVDDIQGMTA